VSADLVVIGNLLVDDVVLSDGSTRMGEAGGATLYVALGASLWAASTAMVTYRGDDYPAGALEGLTGRGVDLTGVHSPGRPGLRAWLLYEGRRRRIVHRLDCPEHAEASPGPERIPDALRGARAFHLAPMPLDVQQSLVASLAAVPGAIVSLDPHVPLGPDTLEAWRGILAGVDVLFLGEDELTDAPEDPRPVLRSLSGGRLRRVVFKRGPRGGIAYDAGEGRFLEWAARADRVVDPTGAGDAFAGGFLAGWLGGDSPERALKRGLVSASFAIEGWGASAIMAATTEAARVRLLDWFGP
jgi:sugar/nucleoside kinase (ribokinase family)